MIIRWLSMSSLRTPSLKLKVNLGYCGRFPRILFDIPIVFDNTQSGACVANEVGIHPGGMLSSSLETVGCFD